MSPLAEDSDPLLAFSTEPDAAAAVASAPAPITQPVQPVADPRREPPPPPSVDALIARVDRLERALDDSKKQVASLKSDVATLVRVVGDIRKPVTRPAAAPARPTPSRMRGVSAVLGMAIGAALGIFAWVSLTDDADTTLAAPAAVSVQALAAAPTPAAVAPIAAEIPTSSDAPEAPAPRRTPATISARPARQPRQTPQTPQAPQAPQAPRYVGTLAIDAAPDGEVFLDRQSAGRTPLRLTNLRAGSHLIWIEREGYRRFTRVVPVPADRVSRLFADLEPIAAR